MALSKMGSFSFNHADQQDDLYKVKSATEIKQSFDSRAEELKTALSNVIDALESVEEGDSGAKNIGVESIADVSGTNVQSVLKSFRDILKSITDGSSGADFIGSTAISGVSGTTIQAQLESIKSLIDDMYNRLELGNTQDGDSGADKIGATPIETSPSTVQGLIEYVWNRINNLIINNGQSDAEIIDARDNGQGTIYPTLRDRFNDSDTRLADTSQRVYKFIRLLSNNQITKITAFGDSIMEGIGATGHVTPPPNTQPKIFDDGQGSIFYEGDYDCNCFANLFRRYISANYPSVQFVNKGISGKSAKWANTNKQYWVGQEDVTFVMLGTNDRWDCATVDEFKQNLAEFLAYVKSHSNLMIVMSATPTLNDYADDLGMAKNSGYNFIMKDVDSAIAAVCAENRYLFISNYRGVLDYSLKARVSLTALLQGRTVGSHPIDAGHFAMWQNVEKELAIVDNTLNFTSPEYYQLIDTIVLDYATLPNDGRFTKHKTTYRCQIGASDPNINQYPECQAGVLTLFKGEHDANIWESYEPRETGRTYRRYWHYIDASTGSWTPWICNGSAFVDAYSFKNPIGFFTSVPAFPDGDSYSYIFSNHPDFTRFFSKQGTLYTHRDQANDLLSWQEYVVTGFKYDGYKKTFKYMREWVGDRWGDFTPTTPYISSTSERFYNPYVGMMGFDYTLNKPIWCSSRASLDESGNITTPATWRDAMGNVV